MQLNGKILIVIGLLILIAGTVIYFAGNKLSWLGHLPGDIHIEKGNFRFYFPVTTILIINIVAILIIKLIHRFF
jgi:hypothetical protein